MRPHPAENIARKADDVMFERFTERARQVIVLAQEEARNNQQGYIGPEHILLGLLREEEGLAARVLASLDVTIEKAREAAHSIAKGRAHDEEELEGQIPFTPRTRKLLELSLREALSLGHNYIGTEHVLLGLLREGDNSAVGILEGVFDAHREKVRSEVIRLLSSKKAPQLQRTPVQEQAEQRDRIAEFALALEELKKTDAIRELLETAALLARQYPDHPTGVIAKAALALHPSV